MILLTVLFYSIRISTVVKKPPMTLTKSMQRLLPWKQLPRYQRPQGPNENIEEDTLANPKKTKFTKTTILRGFGYVMRRDQDSEAAKFWVPFTLRREGMLVFLVIYAILLSALIPLFVFSNRNDGLGTVNEQNYHYLWTYGPTAVFMILAALWSTVQYRAMQLMPWLSMSRGPQSPSNGVLLDYISDWIVISLFRSIKKKHSLVVLVTLTALLLTGATVTSTGLLAVETIHFDQDVRMQLSYKFDGSQFDPSTVDSSAFALQLAIENYNSPSPLGLDGNRVFSPFYAHNSIGPMQNNVSQAVVDVFQMTLKCEEAPINADGRRVIASHPSQNCSFDHQGTSFASHKYNQEEEKEEYELNLVLGGCGKGEAYDTNGREKYLPSEADWRVWAVVARRDPNGILVDTGVWALAYNSNGPYYNKTVGVERFSFQSSVCTPQYSIRDANVTINYTNDTAPVRSHIDLGEQGHKGTISGVTASDILYGTWRSVVKAAKTPDRVAFVLSSAVESNYDQYWGTPRMERMIEQKLPAIAASVVQKYITQPGDEVISGSASGSVGRLMVRDLAFGLVTAMLGLLIITTGLLLTLYLPVAVCPRDPGSIAGLATILARSPDIMAGLIDKGSKPLSEIKSSLTGRQHSTTITPDGDFSITESQGHYAEKHVPKKDDKIQWWRPLSVRIPMRIVAFGVPISLICVLESLHQHSQKNGGIASVGDGDSAVRYTWVYIPALVMLAVRVMFHDLESSARSFQPYNSLQRGEATSKTSIMEDYKGKLSISVLLNAVHKGQWGLAMAALAVLVSFALPIAVSGLYTVETVMEHTPVNITRQDHWTMEKMGEASYLGYSPNMITGLVMYLDFPDPQWTYHDLVLPKVQLPDTVPEQGHLDVRVPAIRSNHRCENIPHDQITFYTGIQFLTHYYADKLIPNITSMPECGFNTGPGDTNNAIDLPASGGYFSRHIKSGGHFCPSDFYFFGKTKGLQYEDVEGLYVIACRPLLELVEVDVRLSLPSYTLDASTPPSIVPNSTTPFGDANRTYSLVPRDDVLEQAMMFFSPVGTENETALLDCVTRAAIYGVNGTKTPDALLDPVKYPEAISRVYGIVTAQFLNNFGRRESNLTELRPGNNDIQNATLSRPRLYVVQSHISTYILEGVLAAMIICGGAAITLLNTRNVLPKNPTTIAAVASLLAGSEMLKESVIPRGSEWCDDKELRRRRIFEGVTFSMKWWPGQKERSDEETTETRSNGTGNSDSRASSRSRSNDESESTLRESLISRESVRSHRSSTVRGSPVSSQRPSMDEVRPDQSVSTEDDAQEEEVPLSEAPSNQALPGDAPDQDERPISERERPRDRFGIDVDQLAVSV